MQLGWDASTYQPQWQGCARSVHSPYGIKRMPTMGEVGKYLPMTVTAERSPNIRGRNLLRYGRTSCHHDFYNQNAVQKVQRIFVIFSNVGFLPQKVRHLSAKTIWYVHWSPAKFNVQIAECLHPYRELRYSEAPKYACNPPKVWFLTYFWRITATISIQIIIELKGLSKRFS